MSKKEEFFQSLDAATWCGWDWCRKVYGYQVTDPDFLKRVYDRLDELNRGRVKNIYRLFAGLEKRRWNQILKDAGGQAIRKQMKGNVNVIARRD